MIFKRLLFFLKANAFLSILGLINSILTVRLLGGEVYGKTAYLLALAAFIPSFYGIFDGTIVRFLGGLAPRRQWRLVFFALSGKISVYLLVLSGFLLWYFLGHDNKLEQALASSALRFFFFATLVVMPFEILSRTCESVLQALEKYGDLIAMRVVMPSILLAMNLILMSVGAAPETAVWWRALQVMAGTLITIAVAVWCLRKSGFLESMKLVPKTRMRSAFVFAYQHYFRGYSQPQSLGVLIFYFKMNLPSLLLTQISGFESLAYYQVFKKLFEAVKRTLPRIADTLLPTVLKAKQSDAAFDRKFFVYSAGYLAAIGVAATAMYVAHPVILAVFGLETSPETSLEISRVALIFAGCLMVASLGFVMNYLLFLSESTRFLYFSSPIGNLAYFALLFALSRYGIVGITAALFLRGLIGNVLFYFFTVRRLKYLKVGQFFSLQGISMVYMGLLLLVYRFRVFPAETGLEFLKGFLGRFRL